MASNITVGILRALLTVDTAQWESGMRKASSSLSKFESDTRKLGQSVTSVGKDMTAAFTLPIVAAFGSAAKAAIDFESSFAGVRKTVDASEPEFKALEQQFRNLAKQIPINVNELNRLGEAAGALGIPKKEIADFTRVMALLGVTTNVTSEQAANDIAKIQNIFGAAGQDTERFASTLVDLGNKGASTEQEILALATRIASAGNTVGLTQAEMLGFSAAIANVGMEAEAGGSAMSRVLNDLSQAVSAGGRDLENFSRVAGMTAASFAKLFREDAATATQKFIEGLGRIKAAGGDLNGTLATLGFTELRQSDLLRRLAGDADGVGTALGTANQAWRVNTALSKEAQERFKTTESQLTLLWNRVKDVGITLGNAFKPAIDLAIKAMDGLIPLIESTAETFRDLPVPAQAAAMGIAGIVAAIGPLTWGFGQFLISGASVIQLLRTIGVVGPIAGAGATTAATGVSSLWASLLPFAAPVAILAGLAAIGLALANLAKQQVEAGSTFGNLVSRSLGAGDLRPGLVGPKRTGDVALSDDSAGWIEGSGIGKLLDTVKQLPPALDLVKAKTTETKDETLKWAESIKKSMTSAMDTMKELAFDNLKNMHKEAADTAEKTADEMLKSFNRRTEAERQMAVKSRDAEFGRAEFAIEMAKRQGATWQEVYAMETRLSKAKLQAAIDDARTEFQIRTAWIDRTTTHGEAEYQTLLAAHNQAVGAMLEEHQRAEFLKRDELDKTHNVWRRSIDGIRTLFGSLTTTISEHFTDAILRATSFKDAFVGIWDSIKKSLLSIFADILNSFTTSLLDGMIGAITGRQGAFSQAFSGLLGGGGSGGGGLQQTAGGALLKALGIGGATSTAFVGGTTAATAAAMYGPAAIASQGVSAGIAAGSAAGAGAAGAGGGGTAAGVAGGIGLGSTIAITGGIAGAALLTYAIWKKGLFRGGEEALKVNPARDEYFGQFQQQYGGGQFESLAAAFADKGVSGDIAERLIKALYDADSMKEFQAATDAIGLALSGAATSANQTAEGMAATGAAMAAFNVTIDRLQTIGTVSEEAISALRSQIAELSATASPEIIQQLNETLTQMIADGTATDDTVAALTSRVVELRDQSTDTTTTTEQFTSATEELEARFRLATSATDGLAQGLATGSSAASGFASAINGVRSALSGGIDVPVRVRVETSGGGAESFAHEGIVRRPTLAVIGDAIEPEFVLHRSTLGEIVQRAFSVGGMMAGFGGMAYAGGGMPSMEMPRSGRSGGDTYQLSAHVTVNGAGKNGSTLADEIADALPQAMRRRHDLVVKMRRAVKETS